MSKRGWKLAGILGAALLMTAGTGMEVRAEETSIKVINHVLKVQDWEGRAVADVDKYVNIRESNTTDAEIVGVLTKGAYIEVVNYGEDWTQVESEDGKIKGYIKTEYLLFDDEAKEYYGEVHGVAGIVKEKSITIYKHPSQKSESVGKKSKGKEVAIIAQIGDWYRVQYDKDTTGYVQADGVEIDEVIAMTLKEYKALTAPKKTLTGAGVYATEREIDMLAAIIQCEAEGESYKGKVAVGAVVLNRVKSKEFPNTIEGVIKEKGQFTPVASGKFARVLSKGANAECYKAARDALSGSNPIGKCLFFNTGYGKGFRLGGHQFY